MQQFGGPAEALRHVQQYYARRLWETQPVVAELWAEADTVSAMLWPVAARWRVPQVVTRGNPSLTLLHDSAQAIAARWENAQTTRILYVGDWERDVIQARPIATNELLRKMPGVDIHVIAERDRVRRKERSGRGGASDRRPWHRPGCGRMHIALRPYESRLCSSPTMP